MMDLLELWQTRAHKVEELSLELMMCRWWKFKQRRAINSKLQKVMFDETSLRDIDDKLESLIRLCSQYNW